MVLARIVEVDGSNEYDLPHCRDVLKDVLNRTPFFVTLSINVNHTVEANSKMLVLSPNVPSPLSCPWRGPNISV